MATATESIGGSTAGAAAEARHMVDADAPSGGWRERVVAFARERLEHVSWGTAHARRGYETTLRLAAEEGVAVDEEVIFAAAYLHDLGAFVPYAAEGVDHAERSARLIDGVLAGLGFPTEKSAHVRKVVRGHMFYARPGPSPESVLFRDADTLDFLGAIGIARILALTGNHRWAPDLRGAMATLRRHAAELPPTLVTDAAKRIAATRIAEMDAFLRAFDDQTLGSSAV